MNAAKGTCRHNGSLPRSREGRLSVLCRGLRRQGPWGAGDSLGMSESGPKTDVRFAFSGSCPSVCSGVAQTVNLQRKGT